jgi:hypothetical protein
VNHETAAEVLGLIEAELWLPRRGVLVGAIRNVTTTFGTPGLLLVPNLLGPFLIGSGAVRVAEAVQMRAVRKRQLSALDALISQLKAMSAVRENAGDVSSYRGGDAADALASVSPAVEDLFVGRVEAQLVQYRIARSAGDPVARQVHGLCVAATDAPSIVAHVWAEHEEAWIAALVERLDACLVRCVSRHVARERWSWQLGVPRSLVVA